MLILWNPNKHSGHRDSVEFCDGWTHWCTGIVMHWLLWERARKLSGTLPNLPFLLWLFLIWLFLSCLLYKKTIIINIALSWIMWVIWVNFETGVVLGNPESIIDQQKCGRPLRLEAGICSEGRLVEIWALTPVEADTEGSARIVRSTILEVEITHFW